MSRTDFTTIRTEGALLPPGLLKRLREPKNGLPGTDEAAYHVAPPRRLTEVISEAWNTLQGTWTAYRTARDRLPDSETGTTLTREAWLQPLFQALGYGRLLTRTATTVDGVTFPISHGWHHVPIHLVSHRVDLDRRTAGVAGAARTSPHGLVQSYLNATDDSLWGVVSNGHRLRLLRDHHALTRPSYVEYDLEAMFDGEVYSDFVLLYLTLHQSRLEAKAPTDTLLEQWATLAREQGTRALDRLRDGVERALKALGQGFLDHPANGALRERLRSGDLAAQDYYRQLLRLVYRLLVLFAAEDRDLLHPPDTSEAARERYQHYGTRRLREIADRVRGGAHPDRYETLKRLTHWLAHDGAPAIGIPALGGSLFSPGATADLDGAHLTNHAFFGAIRALAFTATDGARLPVDYRNLGAEELGSVYESLLELHPTFEHDRFALTTAAGNERKTTGSYYTPTSLITILLDSALDPVLDDAARAVDPERAILDLKLVDPASGSGHFLIAAAHRVARRLAQVRTGDDEPAIDATRTALRDVIGHCLYATDLNPMAVELCKVALWLEALEPGKPLTFLDHRIKTGNSLLGADPTKTTADLVTAGIPDEAFAPLTGDDRTYARGARDRNRLDGRRGAPGRASRMIGLGFFATTEAPDEGALARAIHALDAAPDDTITAVRSKERAFAALQHHDAYRRARDVADAYFAAFPWPKHDGAPAPITNADLADLADGTALTPERRAHLDALTRHHRPFHWRLEYPDVFDRDHPGFDVVLGNPPWERIKIQEREWFASRDPDVANAPTAAARGSLIRQLQDSNPALHAAFLADLHAAEAESQFIRTSGRYPLCGRGDVNTYTIFAELNRQILHPRGRAGFIVPSGIATDDTTKHYFRAITEERNLVSLYDFENRNRIFPGIDSRIKFALVTLTGSQRPTEQAAFVFFAHEPADVLDDDRRFTLSADEIALLNPNTRTCPTFRSKRDAAITKGIYRRVPVLVNEETGENPWGVRFMTMFHMANDSGLFRTREDLERDGYRVDGNVYVRGVERFLPLYEAKMFHQFDHRFATFDGTDARNVHLDEHADAAFEPMPRYWVPEAAVEERRATSRSAPDRGTDWMLAFRNIARSTDERTGIFAALPHVALGHSGSVLTLAEATPERTASVLAALNSLVCDYVLRQSLGGSNLSFFVLRQLPVPGPSALADHADWITRRVATLSATSTRLATAMGLAPPSDWVNEQRWRLRIELDALFFIAYGVGRDDASYILDTFPILNRRDEEQHGHRRTKDAILATFDAISASRAASQTYESPLDHEPSHQR